MSLLLSILANRQKKPTPHTYSFAALIQNRDLFNGRHSPSWDGFSAAKNKEIGASSYAQIGKSGDYYYSGLAVFANTSQETADKIAHLHSLDSSSIISAVLSLEFSGKAGYAGSIFWDTKAGDGLPTSFSGENGDNYAETPIYKNAEFINIDVSGFGIPASGGWLFRYDRSSSLVVKSATLTVNTMEV